MDYLFFSSLAGSQVTSLVVSYDIACQWSIKLWACMKTYNTHLQLDLSTCRIVFLVPRFHLPAHVDSCQTSFSFNLTKHVGWTDGEAPERGWADINWVATSTHEMGPGSCADTLDDHFGDWNWKKIVSIGLLLILLLNVRFWLKPPLGPTLLRKLKLAVPERNQQLWALEQMEISLPTKSVMEWHKAVELWEEDSSAMNPFINTQKSKASFRTVITPTLTPWHRIDTEWCPPSTS